MVLSVTKPAQPRVERRRQLLLPGSAWLISWACLVGFGGPDRLVVRVVVAIGQRLSLAWIS